jgi:hypothetical protein
VERSGAQWSAVERSGAQWSAVERGNLKKGTEKKQIASAKGPRNDGGIAKKKKINSLAKVRSKV